MELAELYDLQKWNYEQRLKNSAMRLELEQASRNLDSLNVRIAGIERSLAEQRRLYTINEN